MAPVSLLIHFSSSLSCRQPPRRDNNSPCEPRLFPPLFSISLWVTMTFQLHPFTHCLPHCQPLDPPHYGQQIAVLTDSHFDGADACRLLSCFFSFCFFAHKHTCQCYVYQTEAAMGLWPSENSFVALHRRWNEARGHLCRCLNLTNVSFAQGFPLDPGSSHPSLLINTCLLKRQNKNPVQSGNLPEVWMPIPCGA